MVVLIGSEPSRREPEGALLQQGPCFLSKEPWNAVILGSGALALVAACGPKAAAFWKGVWSLGQTVSGPAVSIAQFRPQMRLQAT